MPIRGGDEGAQRSEYPAHNRVGAIFGLSFVETDSKRFAKVSFVPPPEIRNASVDTYLCRAFANLAQQIGIRQRCARRTTCFAAVSLTSLRFVFAERSGAWEPYSVQDDWRFVKIAKLSDYRNRCVAKIFSRSAK